MTPSLDLRPGVAQDVAAIAEVWTTGWREAHLGNVPEALVDVRTPASFLERAAAELDRITVAVVDGGVAGFVTVGEDEVEQLYVDTSHRGTGAATALLRHAEEQIAERGHSRAWLAVVAGNPRARRFYERSGWVDAGPFEHQAPGPEGDIAVPAHRYVKHLSGPPGR